MIIMALNNGGCTVVDLAADFFVWERGSLLGPNTRNLERTCMWNIEGNTGYQSDKQNQSLWALSAYPGFAGHFAPNLVTTAPPLDSPGSLAPHSIPPLFRVLDPPSTAVKTVKCECGDGVM